MTESQRLEQRAKDVISRHLVQRLTIPNVYFDAPWPEMPKTVDILAIDRAGSGDAHIIEIQRDVQDAIKVAPVFMRVPAQFRWLAYFADTRNANLDSELEQSLLPAEGMGRIGTIEIIQMPNGELATNISIRAERFPGTYRKEIARFVADNEADIAVGQSDSELPSNGPQSQSQQGAIQRRLAEARTLLKSGHEQAALVLAWSAAEAAMRSLASKEGFNSMTNSSRALVQSLRDLGLLGSSAHLTLMRGLTARARIVHGIESEQNVETSVEALISVTESILSNQIPQPQP